MKNKIILLFPVLFIIITQLPVIAQTDTTIHRITLRQEEVNKAGNQSVLFMGQSRYSFS